MQLILPRPFVQSLKKMTIWFMGPIPFIPTTPSILQVAITTIVAVQIAAQVAVAQTVEAQVLIKLLPIFIAGQSGFFYA